MVMDNNLYNYDFSLKIQYESPRSQLTLQLQKTQKKVQKEENTKKGQKEENTKKNFLQSIYFNSSSKFIQ